MQEVVIDTPNVQIMSFNNKMSLYIPRIYKNPIVRLVQERSRLQRDNSEEAVVEVIREFVKDYFVRADFGVIQRVDIRRISMKTGETFYRAFVHFEEWNENEFTTGVQDSIRDSSSYKWWIYGVDEEKDLYNAFWILAENKSTFKKETDKKPSATERLKELEESYAKNIERYMAEKERLEKLISQDKTEDKTDDKKAEEEE